MNFPADFISSVRPLLGEGTDLLLRALKERAPVSIRLNPFKATRNPMRLSTPLQPVPWSRWGYWLEERPAFTFDPLFHAGYYYVQEASSMFVEHLVRGLTVAPSVCLDLCAAPGGKSVSLLSALPAGSLLVCNDPVLRRAHVLAETLTKFGHPGVMVTHSAARDFAAFPHLFDLVLADAPCSGEGMFRREAAAVEEWSTRNVEMCAARQREILRDVWPALKPGGVLIYSTCTYNRLENEDNALRMANELGAEFVRVETGDDWGISPSFDDRVSAWRFFPHRTRGEGLFVTVLRKAEAEDGTSASRRTRVRERGKGESVRGEASVRLAGKQRQTRLRCAAGREGLDLTRLLLSPDDFDFVESANRIMALPAAYSEMLAELNGGLKGVMTGVEVGVRRGDDFVPSHALAMSTQLNPDAFLRYEVSVEEAISYLRRGTVTPVDAPGGYLLLTFGGEPLGFVKHLVSRANNLYPGEWRIRSGYLPERGVDIFTLPVPPPGS